MRRVDLVLGWISLGGGAVVLLVVAATARWLSVGALLGLVMLANAAVRLQLARGDAPRDHHDGARDIPGRSVKR